MRVLCFDEIIKMCEIIVRRSIQSIGSNLYINKYIYNIYIKEYIYLLMLCEHNLFIFLLCSLLL